MELVLTDAAAHRFPPGVNGIYSTLALTLSTEYDRIVRNGGGGLGADGALRRP